jgi:hypothetical protein
MTVLTVVVAIGFLGCWFFLRQVVFYLVRSVAELEQIEASLTMATLKIASLKERTRSSELKS